MASQELHSQSIHIEELYDHGHQSVYLSEQFGSHEQLQHFKVLNDDIKSQKAYACFKLDPLEKLACIYKL